MLKSYGINKSAVISDEMDYHLEEFRHLGYTILENVIPDDSLEILRNELQRVYKEQEQTFGQENILKINEKNMARAPLCYSDAYLELATNEIIINYVKKVLGNYFILHLQNGIINMPNEEHHQSSWHRDLPYQNWVASEPIGCNAFFCLDEFSPATGATIILPYSHKIDHAPSVRYMEKHAVQVTARAGSVLMFDSMMFHKAGYNSSNIIRRGVNHLYARSIVRQQIDLPEMLKGKYSDDPFLNMLLGYDARSSASVEDFRNRRLKKNQTAY
jgi:ectoine hydroxylase-related dioxygenase (phytanoyl-CoA dioxygenase family)